MATTEAQRRAIRKWRQRNPEKYAAYMDKWRAKHRLRLREYNRIAQRKWRKARKNGK